MTAHHNTATNTPSSVLRRDTNKNVGQNSVTSIEKTQLSGLNSLERMIEVLERFVMRSFQYHHRDKRKRLFYWLL